MYFGAAVIYFHLAIAFPTVSQFQWISLSLSAYLSLASQHTRSRTAPLLRRLPLKPSGTAVHIAMRSIALKMQSSAVVSWFLTAHTHTLRRLSHFSAEKIENPLVSSIFLYLSASLPACMCVCV